MNFKLSDGTKARYIPAFEADMSGFNLQSYLDQFPEVCERKFGRKFDLVKVEKEFEQLRSGGSRLMARDVAKIFDPQRTPFGRYWQPPDLKELEKHLTRHKVFLSPVTGDGRGLVDGLMKVFHSLGVASLVLRMVHPDRFGVFSTPIVHLLQVNRPKTVDLYMAFCEELLLWKERFEIPSVAQTEMALWVYHQQTSLPVQGLEVERARREFESDVWIQRRRMEQVVTPFLESYGPVDLARILCERHPRLAAMLAGVEFERLLRPKWWEVHPRGRRKSKVEVDSVIKELAGHSVIDWGDVRALESVWSVRNKAVHPDQTLNVEEVGEMIERIALICYEWGA